MLLTREKQTARGGTELQLAAWRRHIAPELQAQVHLSVSAVPGPQRPLKPHIFWAHQAADQPSVQNLADPLVQQGIDAFVFVSEWQRAQYIAWFGMPLARSYVIRNAIEPIAPHEKPRSPLRLIYTATPFRGLDVLLATWSRLLETAPAAVPDVELHIYSGMSLYGRPAEDARYESLYRQARALPRVEYHGVVSNEAVREALTQSHIFAYPCTWAETSCLALIEALSSGCLAVVPDLAALPETAGGYAQLYPYQPDAAAHVTRFATELQQAIERLRGGGAPPAQLAAQVDHFAQAYSWNTRRAEWERLLERIIAIYERKI